MPTVLEKHEAFAAIGRVLFNDRTDRGRKLSQLAGSVRHGTGLRGKGHLFVHAEKGRLKDDEASLRAVITAYDLSDHAQAKVEELLLIAHPPEKKPSASKPVVAAHMHPRPALGGHRAGA